MRKVSLRKCRNCTRYDGHACHLDDLEPCSYVPRDQSKRAKDIFLTLVTIICGVLIAIIILFACKEEEEMEAQEPISAVALLRGESLSRWEELIMAIAYTESKFKEDAVGETNDLGVLQITPIYVEEVNRVNGTNFRHEDAFSMELSLEMFKAMNEAKNKEKDIEKAIHLHNKSPEYRRRVMENLKLIERYEEFRKLVKE